jgi:tRNA threonylcarbamoyladenosine biosynthesis protein TsaE
MPLKVIQSNSIDETKSVGQIIGNNLVGGEVIELISDLGGGKTTFVKGLAHGFGSKDPVTSPTFTINNVYPRHDGKRMFHFDFYRLEAAGIVADELAEAAKDKDSVVVVEWGEIVHDVLPKERMVITIGTSGENIRNLHLDYPDKLEYLLKKL